MATEPRRTLVVDHAFLDGFRRRSQELRNEAETDAARNFAEGMVDAVNSIIAHGTTVDMAPEKVAGFAKALVQAAETRKQADKPIYEPSWAAKEREQDRVYSEAQAAVDADWTPSGGAA